MFLSEAIKMTDGRAIPPPWAVDAAVKIVCMTPPVSSEQIAELIAERFGPLVEAAASFQRAAMLVNGSGKPRYGVYAYVSPNDFEVIRAALDALGVKP